MSLICIFAYVCALFRNSHWLYLCALLIFTSDFVEQRSTVLWVLESCQDRRSCSLSRDGVSKTRGESGSRPTSATTDEARIPNCTAVLRFLSAPPLHCRVLSDEWYADYIRFKYQLIRLLMPGITNRSLPDLWCQQSVSLPSSTTLFPRHVCCSAPTACHWLRILGDILGFILCYRPLFPVHLSAFP